MNIIDLPFYTINTIKNSVCIKNFEKSIFLYYFTKNKSSHTISIAYPSLDIYGKEPLVRTNPPPPFPNSRQC